MARKTWNMGPLGAVHGTPQLSSMKENSMQHKLIGLILVLAVPVLLAPSVGCGPVTGLDLNGLFGDLFGQGTDDGTNGTGDTEGVDDGTGGTNDGGDTGGTDGTDGTDGTNDGGGTGGTSGLTVVKTTAQIHCQAGIAAGDDIIYYGSTTSSASTGMNYMIPSSGATTGTAIPGSTGFVAYSFAVAGRKAALATQEFQIFIFDPASPTTATAISLDDIHLSTIPIGYHTPGHVQGSGNYFAVRNETSPLVKAIDVSGTTAQVISFTVDPDTTPWHVAVDGVAKKVLAVATDTFYVYDILNPTAAPLMFDASGSNGVNETVAPVFNNGYVLYFDDAGYANARILNTATGAITLLSQNPVGGINVAMNNGKFINFLDRAGDNDYDSWSIVNRVAVGTPPGPDAAVGGQAGDTREYEYPWDDFGSVASITPDARYLFISGWESINIMSEFLQVSTGGASFSPFVDGTGFLNATDVSASNNTVAFKIGENEDTRVGYIRLP
jgi:hypothetical protein